MNAVERQRFVTVQAVGLLGWQVAIMRWVCEPPGQWIVADVGNTRHLTRTSAVAEAMVMADNTGLEYLDAIPA